VISAAISELTPHWLVAGGAWNVFLQNGLVQFRVGDAAGAQQIITLPLPNGVWRQGTASFVRGGETLSVSDGTTSTTTTGIATAPLVGIQAEAWRLKIGE